MIVAAMVMAAAKSVWDRMFLPSLRPAMRSGNGAMAARHDGRRPIGPTHYPILHATQRGSRQSADDSFPANTASDPGTCASKGRWRHLLHVHGCKPCRIDERRGPRGVCRFALSQHEDHRDLGKQRSIASEGNHLSTQALEVLGPIARGQRSLPSLASSAQATPSFLETTAPGAGSSPTELRGEPGVFVCRTWLDRTSQRSGEDNC
jgi:hypothetical protein